LGFSWVSLRKNVPYVEAKYAQHTVYFAHPKPSHHEHKQIQGWFPPHQGPLQGSAKATHLAT